MQQPPSRRRPLMSDQSCADHALYQGTALAVPLAAEKSVGFSPCRFFPCQIVKAVRKLFGRFGQPRLNRILGNVLSMSQEALFVLNPHLGKPALPDLSGVSEFFLQPVGESTLDELHDSFNRHVAPDGKQ